MQRRQRLTQALRRASALGGSCALSDSSVASAKPRLPQRTMKARATPGRVQTF